MSQEVCQRIQNSPHADDKDKRVKPRARDEAIAAGFQRKHWYGRNSLGNLEPNPTLVTRTSRDVEHLGQVPGAIGHVVLASSIGMYLVALLERFDMMYRFAHGGVEYRC